MKSYISFLRSSWKDYLQSDGIHVKITTHEYTSNFLYPQLGGIVPKNVIFNLLNRFYKERITFVQKEKHDKFKKYFKEAFKIEIGWK